MDFKKILVRAIQLLPRRFVNWAGAAQFRYPFIAPVIRKIGRVIRNNEIIISSGAAKGLRIHGQHGYPGYVLGTTEPEQQAWLVKNIKEGDVVYDIGANIGFFALLCAKLTGASGQVEAFEPNPICADACRSNIALNGFNHANVHDIALSDLEGEVSFYFPQNATAVGRILTTQLQSEGGSTFNVRTDTIDNYIRKNGLRSPDLLIIDVEGHEIQVLEGAHDTIKRHLPVINCEVHWLGVIFNNYFKEKLEPLGYRLEDLAKLPVSNDPQRWQAIMTCNPDL